MCTCIVDGVPMYSRGPKELYNGKLSTKYWTFQVFVMLDGYPLTWNGPFEGRTHDSECLSDHGVPGFTHKVDEILIADKAYHSVRHCLCQEKGTTVDENFDLEFRRNRNRNERFFGRLDHHKIMHYNQHSRRFVKSAYGLLWNSECLHWQHREFNSTTTL